jgi:tRNA modification GTPase
MEFIHRPYQPGETIAAIATPPGEGGIAVIRITGKEALTVANRFFSGDVRKYASHTAHYGKVSDLEGSHVDSTLLLVMLGNRSYAGEDTVEIHCHGGSLITRRVLEVVLKAGARLALPGEFTFKAFMNGKLDLTQAEAVQEVICAKNELALDAAGSQLQGSLSQRITSFQFKLVDITAILEAWVDFPEEGIEFASMEEICTSLELISSEIKRLIQTFHDGKKLHEGISLCLAGCPNVGKSSLMNALLEKERAIVTHIPGTTRDLLEDELRLNGLNVRITDTAGIRETDEIIEQEGIRRSKEAINHSDLILLILDVSRGIQEEDEQLLAQLPPGKTIVVWNKMDLPAPQTSQLPMQHVAHVSAKEKIGLDALRSLIDKVIWEKGAPSKEEVIITNLRHKEALENCFEACQAVIRGLQDGTSPEFLTIDMRKSLSELGTIIGTNITDDILSAIFSKFCIGK